MRISPATHFLKPLILCIDDSDTRLWLRAQVLEKNGFSVLNATTACGALDLLRHNSVCLILSDHMLSGTTGAKLAGEMKRVKPHVPVVLYSGSPPDTLANVDCFIQKNQSVAGFVVIIRDLVNRYCK
jgi:CheY-like chemotaxis protein